MSAIFAVTIPKWGIEMQEGTVTEWRVQEGAKITRGDELVDIESDKIVNTMEAPASGVLRRVLAEVDSTLKVGQLLGVIAPDDVSEQDVQAFIDGFVPADAGFGIDDEDSTPKPAGTTDSSNAPAAPEPPPGKDETAQPAGSDKRSTDEHAPGERTAGKASPVARRLAKKLGVDLSTVRGTGRNGRISTADVEATAAGAAGAESPSADEVVALSSRELAAARRLVASKQEIPHFYLQRDLDMTAALAAKQREGVPLTALLLKALAKALLEQPRINAHLNDDQLTLQTGVAINVAVDTAEGLVAPLLRAVDSRGVEQLAGELKNLAERARNKALSAPDLKPGGLTLSNLGMFGITEFTAIINPPQVAILAAGNLRPLCLEHGGDVVSAMTVTLSCDHRAIDGAQGARFLAALQDALNTL